MAVLQITTRTDQRNSSENQVDRERTKLEFATAALTLCQIDLWCAAFLNEAARHGPRAEAEAVKSPEYKQALKRYDQAVQIAYKPFRALGSREMYSDELAIELAMRTAVAARKLSLTLPEAQPIQSQSVISQPVQPPPAAPVPAAVSVTPSSKTVLADNSFRGLSNRLRRVIKAKIDTHELTGTSLASSAGFTQAHLSNFLSCRRGCSVEGLDSLCSRRG